MIPIQYSNHYFLKINVFENHIYRNEPEKFANALNMTLEPERIVLEIGRNCN